MATGPEVRWAPTCNGHKALNCDERIKACAYLYNRAISARHERHERHERRARYSAQ